MEEELDGPGPDYYYRDQASEISKEEEDIGYNEGAPSQYSEDEEPKDEEQINEDQIDEEDKEDNIEPELESLEDLKEGTLSIHQEYSQPKGTSIIEEKYETESVEGENFVNEPGERLD
jgi:hypothetical protein